MPSEQHRKSISIRNLVVVSAFVTAALCVAMLVIASQISTTGAELEAATEDYIECERAAVEMQTGTDYLANQARAFVMTENRRYLDQYYEEAYVTQRREEAVDTLEDYVGDGQAKQYLEEALEGAYELQEHELHAIKLICLGRGIAQRDARAMLDDVALSAEELDLSFPDKRDFARDLLLSEEYEEAKEEVDADVSRCIEELIDETAAREGVLTDQLGNLLQLQAGLTFLMLLTAGVTIGLIAYLVLRPLHTYTQLIEAGRDLNPHGGSELRYLASAYNDIARESRLYQESLLAEAEHDALTGLLNRNAYDRLYREAQEGGALLLVDVDWFKDVNDEHGHEVGDRVLQRIARELVAAMGERGEVCRIGGDEFAAVIPGATPAHRADISDACERLAATLARPDRDLPATTLSIGIAFAGDGEGDGSMSLYKAADTALYAVKDRGRNGLAFYSEVAGA